MIGFTGGHGETCDTGAELLFFNKVFERQSLYCCTQR